MIIISEAFARDTITREGEAGRKWLASLPRLVTALCNQWKLTYDLYESTLPGRGLLNSNQHFFAYKQGAKQ